MDHSIIHIPYLFAEQKSIESLVWNICIWIQANIHHVVERRMLQLSKTEPEFFGVSLSLEVYALLVSDKAKKNVVRDLSAGVIH